MGAVELLLLGIALSMDAFAVTITNSFCYQGESRARLMLMPVFFGVFQGVMPLLGYFLGSLAADLVARFAGIISFVILGYIGGHMIWEAVKAMRAGESGEEVAQGRLTVAAVLIQAVATSIDAFGVGISLLASGANIAVAAPVIALTTFVCCVIALVVGKRFGSLLGDRAQIVGGIVLVAIGVKSLLF